MAIRGSGAAAVLVGRFISLVAGMASRVEVRRIYARGAIRST
jgi:hypothetical protein